MSNTLQPPLERIGPYRILGKLGAGGMGTVYKALQESLQRPVAMKVVNPESAADARFQERFLREARAMAKIQSPYVIACYYYCVIKYLLACTHAQEPPSSPSAVISHDPFRLSRSR